MSFCFSLQYLAHPSSLIPDKLIVSLKQLMVDEPDITNEELNTFLQD